MVDSSYVNKLKSHHKGRVMDAAFDERVNGRWGSNFAGFRSYVIFGASNVAETGQLSSYYLKYWTQFINQTN